MPEKPFDDERFRFEEQYRCYKRIREERDVG